MRLGKLSNQELERLVLSHFQSRRDEVVVAPGVGLDCAVIDFADSLCAVSSDPITAASSHIGALAVHVCCNDAASAGAKPVGILTTYLLPADTTNETIDHISADVAHAAELAGIDVLGGHTEFTDAVTRPVISATVLAKAPRGQQINAGNMQPGDGLYMTKWAGIEGSFIIAADGDPARLGALLDDSERAEALRWRDELSVVDAAEKAVQCGVHAMHDATEGGILGAAWEMADASSCGLLLDAASIPIHPITQRLAEGLGFAPLRLMASGCLLLAVTPEVAEKLRRELGKIDVALTQIAQVVAREKGVRCDGQLLDPPGADELYRVMRDMERADRS